MKQSLLLVCLAACGSSPAASSPAAPAATTPPAPAASGVGFDADHISGELDPYVASLGGGGDAYGFSGYVHVVAGDRVLYSRAFGWADRTAHRKATADTSFRVGSVTKQFTAAAIMLLQQEGKLAVTDTIRAHLPDYPAPAGDQITIAQLLTHTAGIPNYTDAPATRETRARPHTVAELLKLFDAKPLEFTPGSRFKYSNSGYIVLGAIIEKVSGTSYAQFLEQRLFAPAGLTRTVVGDADDMDDRAIGYQLGETGTVEAAHPIDMSMPFAAGAVRSTAADLVRWSRVLEAGNLISAASQEAMYTPSKPSVHDDTGYGYGWMIVRGEHTVIEHDGGIDGFLTSYARVPKDGLVVVVWTNVPENNPGAITKAALKVAYGGHVEPMAYHLDAALAARQIGHYRLDAASLAAAKKLLPPALVQSILTIDIRRAGPGLRLAPVGQNAVPLEQREGGTLANDDIHLVVTMDLPAGDGAATGMTLTQGSLRLHYIRE